MKLTNWLNNHIIGMIFFAILTGVAGNYTYSYLSEKYSVTHIPDYKLVYFHPNDIEDNEKHIVAKFDLPYMISNPGEIMNSPYPKNGNVFSLVWIGSQAPDEEIKKYLLNKYGLNKTDWIDSADLKKFK